MMNLKALAARYVSGLSPSVFFRLSYIHNRWRLPSFSHPKDISEIWIRYVLDGKPKALYSLADKYLVRSYVEKCVGGGT